MDDNSPDCVVIDDIQLNPSNGGAEMVELEETFPPFTQSSSFPFTQFTHNYPVYLIRKDTGAKVPVSDLEALLDIVYSEVKDEIKEVKIVAERAGEEGEYWAEKVYKILTDDYDDWTNC